MDTAACTILLVDDDPTLCTVFETVLRRRGYSVLTASSAEEALDILRDHTVSAIISDLHMPKMNGLEMLKHLHDNGSKVPAILITGQLEEIPPKAPGVTTVLSKPIAGGLLLSTLKRLLSPKKSGIHSTAT